MLFHADQPIRLHYSHQIKLFDQIYGLQFVFTQIYLFYLIQGYIYIEAKSFILPYVVIVWLP